MGGLETGTIALWVCGAYLVVTLIMGLVPGLRVSKSVAGYVAADRAMSFLVLYFVLGASVFSSFAFLGGPGWAYSRGASAFYIIAYGVIGMVPLYFFGPRARRLGERFGFVTQAELLAARYESRGVSILLALLSVGAFIPYLTIQMKGAGYILNTISGDQISQAAGAALTYGVVVVYVLFSGVLGVGWTNTFQGAFMMVIAWFLGLYLPYKLYGGVGAMFDQLAASTHAAKLEAPGLLPDGEPWSWLGFSSIVLVSAFGFSMWPHLFMKSYAAQSDRALRLTVVLYPTFQLFLVPILLIGFAGILAFPGVEPSDTILPFLLTQIDISPWLIGLVCAGTLAASMSSGDSILHAAASIAVRDGARQAFPGRLDDRKEQSMIRICVLLLFAASFYFVLETRVSLVDLLLAAYGGIAQIFPLMFAAFYWPRATGKAAFWALFAGLAVNVFFLRFPEMKPAGLEHLHEGIFGLAVNVPLLIGLSLVTRPQRQEHVMKFADG
ncbi:MAG: sodium:solute symporter family protein [Acidobacteriota bacterium]